MKKKKGKYRSVADDLILRAYKLNISVSTLCRYAGVSRTTFERMRKTTPRSIENYLKLNEVINKLEIEKEYGSQDNTGKTKRN